MIISRTPFRLSFAGGGTDLNSYYRHGYGQVVSTAIDKYMYIAINKRFDDTIRLSYSKTEIVDHADAIKHPIVRVALSRLGIAHGVEIVSIADIPAGTGLGSSSSFTVGLLHALYAYLGKTVSAEQLAAEACEIEIEDLGEPIGKQDQYIAAYGGLKKIRFNADETVAVDSINGAEEAQDFINRHLMMFYTGTTRSASAILKEHRKRTGSNMDRLNAMRDMADDVADVIAGGSDLLRLGEILHEGWLLKRGVADGTTTDGIDDAYERARAAGAIGGKIAGAGGGGFLFLFAKPERHDAIRQAVQLREIPFSLEAKGSEIIHMGRGNQEM